MITESNNCPTCKGTRWHNAALCYVCEMTPQQATETALERVRLGKLGPDAAVEALHEFAKPSCFALRDISDADSAKALEDYQASVLERAPKAQA